MLDLLDEVNSKLCTLQDLEKYMTTDGVFYADGIWVRKLHCNMFFALGLDLDAR